MEPKRHPNSPQELRHGLADAGERWRALGDFESCVLALACGGAERARGPAGEAASSDGEDTAGSSVDREGLARLLTRARELTREIEGAVEERDFLEADFPEKLAGVELRLGELQGECDG